MSKLCKQYSSNVKAFFPLMGKSEKIYLAKLMETVDDYCTEENVTTVEEIYEEFGRPDEVVATYLNNQNTAYLIRKIQTAKWIKRGIAAMLLLALIGVSIYGAGKYYAYKILEEETVYMKDSIIEDVD
ncbi:MAG: DUF6120 family protein [Ruminococcus flavefaciens]|nr:DUF6120 family protein [Ruminococcus flavefaciens]